MTRKKGVEKYVNSRIVGCRLMIILWILWN